MDASKGFPKRISHNFWLFAALLTFPLIAGACQKPSSQPNIPSAPVRSAAEAVAEADQLYAGRADLTKVREGLVALRQAQADDSTNYDLAWRLSKFNYYLGAHTTESSEKEKSFHDGIEAGKLAVKLQDGKPDGHFWLGANYGGNAKLSVLAGLSDFEDIKREMETVLKLDERYQSGSPYMALGQLYLEAPRILGGDAQKAVDYLEKGVRIGPDNALMRWHLAAAYAELHRDADARREIDYLLAMKPAAGYEPEYEEAVAEVRKLQEKMKQQNR
ncbi:MAG: TRAP transporter TatT component family protein [Acidobacteriota bacterium]